MKNTEVTVLLGFRETKSRALTWHREQLVPVNRITKRALR
jgi:hypothetical protein